MVSKHRNEEYCPIIPESRLFPWFRLWPCCGDSIKLIIPMIIPNYSFQFQLFLWLGCSNRSRRKAGPATVPAPPLRGRAADTTAPLRRRQPLIPLLCHSCLRDTIGRYHTAAASASVSNSRRLARHRREDSLKTRCHLWHRESAVPPHLTLFYAVAANEGWSSLCPVGTG